MRISRLNQQTVLNTKENDMNTNYYQELSPKSTVSNPLLAYAHEAEYQAYYNFSAAEVPKEMLLEDAFLSTLQGKWRAGVLRMEPNTCYNWHTDTDRKYSINMLLNYDGVSHCVFGGNDAVQFPIVELEYKPDTYYLLDTAQPHMVLNIDKPRYMFSVEFDREQDDEDDEDEYEEEGTWQCQEEEYKHCQVVESVRECLTNE